ncbi:hypothetical protein [Actinotalea sp. Marseille-Q4924]|uniref:hypothetical protein n=1 Tax=Actinotalea sp. Marseille-Q4924 TaxID=2866571 RepID=UPI001CE3BB68|nr:hypothetical protein [Actinotalea sp. Marseille-Q4924]
MQLAPAPAYAGWVVNHGDPDGKVRMLEQPRRAVVDAHTYGGHQVRLQLFVIATAPGWVCVEQDLAERAPWRAWVPSRTATPV